MFCFQWKRLCKNKVIYHAFLVYGIYVGYLLWVNHTTEVPSVLVDTVMMHMPITFLLFESTSFSFFSKSTECIREIVRGGGKGIHKDYLSGICIFVLALFIRPAGYHYEDTCVSWIF